MARGRSRPKVYGGVKVRQYIVSSEDGCAMPAGMARGIGIGNGMDVRVNLPWTHAPRSRATSMLVTAADGTVTTVDTRPRRGRKPATATVTSVAASEDRTLECAARHGRDKRRAIAGILARMSPSDRDRFLAHVASSY